MWQSRRWRFLLNLIDHLPRHSFYVEAMANDDELAAELPDDLPPMPERVSQWTPEREALAAIFDRLGVLISVTFAASTGKTPPTFDLFPRPETATQRIHGDKAIEVHESLVSRLLGPEPDA